MKKRFLNVQYLGQPARIDTKDMEDLSQICKEVLVAFKEITVSYSKIQLYDNDNSLVNDLDEIAEVYYKKLKENGLSLTVQLLPSPTSSRQPIDANLLASAGTVLSYEVAQRNIDTNLTTFWLSLPETSPSNDILTFPIIPKFFPEGLKAIYIRQSYIDLFAMILNLEKEELHCGKKLHRMAITGNPGIGKSVFLFYVLWRLSLICTTETVILRREKDEGRILVFQRNDCWITKNPDLIDQYLDDKCTWYLTDTLSKPPGEIVKAVTIVVSSPATKHYSEFLKHSATDILRFLPVWSLEELHASCSLFSTMEDQVTERHTLIGGLVRFVLEKKEQDLRKLINEAMNKTDFGKLKNINMQEKDKVDEFSHRVIHFIIDSETFEKCGLQFSSEFVLNEALTRLQLTTIQKQTEFLLRTENVGVLGSYRGHVFEAIAHTKISQGGKFRIRPLDGGNEEVLQLPKMDQRLFKEFYDCRKGVYWKPVSKSYACIDSLILDQAVFQMTVSESHPIKMQRMADIVQTFGFLPLYFVVPSSISESFKMQPFHTVGGKVTQSIPKNLRNLKQWAFCIDLEGKKRKLDSIE